MNLKDPRLNLAEKVLPQIRTKGFIGRILDRGTIMQESAQHNVNTRAVSQTNYPEQFSVELVPCRRVQMFKFWR